MKIFIFEKYVHGKKAITTPPLHLVEYRDGAGVRLLDLVEKVYLKIGLAKVVQHVVVVGVDAYGLECVLKSSTLFE